MTTERTTAMTSLQRCARTWNYLISQAGRSLILAACADSNCIGFLWPSAEPLRGFDIKDMIEPKGLSNTDFTG